MEESYPVRHCLTQQERLAWRREKLVRRHAGFQDVQLVCAAAEGKLCQRVGGTGRKIQAPHTEDFCNNIIYSLVEWTLCTSLQEQEGSSYKNIQLYLEDHRAEAAASVALRCGP